MIEEYNVSIISQYTNLSEKELSSGDYDFGIIDCDTLNCFGVCRTKDDAIAAAEHCHKHSYSFTDMGYQINAFKIGECKWGYSNVVHMSNPDWGT